jgi:hypothetical protein
MLVVGGGGPPLRMLYQDAQHKPHGVHMMYHMTGQTRKDLQRTRAPCTHSSAAALACVKTFAIPVGLHHLLDSQAFGGCGLVVGWLLPAT